MAHPLQKMLHCLVYRHALSDTDVSDTSSMSMSTLAKMLMYSRVMIIFETNKFKPESLFYLIYIVAKSDVGSWL